MDSMVQVALLALVALGLTASMAGYMEFQRGGGLCDISSWISCSKVYYIPEARILGVHLSEAAPVYFMLLAGVAAAHGLTGSREALRGILVLAVVGVVIVPYLVYLEIFKARAICIFCTIMHVSIIGTLILSIMEYRRLEG